MKKSIWKPLRLFAILRKMVLQLATNKFVKDTNSYIIRQLGAANALNFQVANSLNHQILSEAGQALDFLKKSRIFKAFFLRLQQGPILSRPSDLVSTKRWGPLIPKCSSRKVITKKQQWPGKSGYFFCYLKLFCRTQQFG